MMVVMKMATKMVLADDGDRRATGEGNRWQLCAQHCSTPNLYGDYDADDDHHGGGCDDNVGYK